MSEYGFTVRPPNPDESYPLGWMVFLPHQCDWWEITKYEGADTKEEAIADMEQFIAEAQAALEELKAA